jgi:hypothetical protein
MGQAGIYVACNLPVPLSSHSKRSPPIRLDVTGCNPSFQDRTSLHSPTVRRAFGKRGGQVSASHAAKVYRRRFVSTRLAATLLANGAPCFAICACPALVIKRDCSYISIHFSLEIAEISLPIASSGKSSGDSK